MAVQARRPTAVISLNGVLTDGAVQAAVRPRRGVFSVHVRGVPVLETGPEPRPFPVLKALDVEAAAAKVVQELD